MRNRAFELEEVNQLLPKIQPLVEALGEKKKKMSSLHDQLLTLELIQNQEKENDFYLSEEGKEYLAFSKELEALVVSFEEDLKAFHELGCLLRDIEKGIVDFYHVFQERVVFLTWEKDDTTVQYWHDVDESYQEKQPLTELSVQ